MTYLALLRSPLTWAALAALMGWLALHQRDAKRDALAEARAAQAVIASLNDYAVAVQGIEATLRDGMEAINAIPDTDGCGAPVDAALERLRQSR